MAKNHGAREQKRLAKQKAKRDSRRRELARQTSSNPTIRFSTADRWPIVASLVGAELWDTGIGSAIIARKMPDGQLACALFLLDVYCLGVKDTHWRIVPPDEFDSLRKHIEGQEGIRNVSPEHLSKLVYQTADYGQSLGFAPHASFRHAQRLLAGIDPSLCADEFEFGRDGRPFYIAGPFEPPERAQQIADRIAKLGGHFMLPLDPNESPAGLPDGFESLEEE